MAVVNVAVGIIWTSFLCSWFFIATGLWSKRMVRNIESRKIAEMASFNPPAATAVLFVRILPYALRVAAATGALLAVVIVVAGISQLLD